MAFHLYEDTWETTTTTGTGAYTLAGAVSGRRSFSAQYTNGDTCWYTAFDGTNFELGLGTYASSGTTLTRTTIYRSTNSNAAVNWSAGTRQIMVAPLGVTLESIFTPGSVGVPQRSSDNVWAYINPVLTVQQQSFTASGTYTPSAGMIYCQIQGIGGGGGGGGIAGGTAQSGGGGGGGGGGWVQVISTASAVGASQTVTIGAGGAGGTAGNNAGSSGGSTSVGAILQASGGSGGGGSSGNFGQGGLGGTTTSAGFFAAAGGAGMSVTGGPSASVVAGVGGAGGNSRGGAGGVGVLSASSAQPGAAGVRYGAGGSGASASNTTGTAAGGAGTAGVVWIVEFCTQ